MQNARNHVSYFNSDIYKGKPYIMNDVKLFISCFLVNARSIINKMDVLECYVNALQHDLIMITESWASEDISDAELSIDDFATFRSDKKLSVGGACMFYVKNCHSATLVEVITNVPDTETVWCKLILSNMSILIGVCCHTAPATVVNEIALHSTIRKACSMNDDVIICGDFNHSSIDWNTLHTGSESQEILDLVLDCFLIQHIREPT